VDKRRQSRFRQYPDALASDPHPVSLTGEIVIPRPTRRLQGAPARTYGYPGRDPGPLWRRLSAAECGPGASARAESARDWHPVSVLRRDAIDASGIVTSSDPVAVDRARLRRAQRGDDIATQRHWRYQGSARQGADGQWHETADLRPLPRDAGSAPVATRLPWTIPCDPSADAPNAHVPPTDAGHAVASVCAYAATVRATDREAMHTLAERLLALPPAAEATIFAACAHSTRRALSRLLKLATVGGFSDGTVRSLVASGAATCGSDTDVTR
jgi:hypothetical protein